MQDGKPVVVRWQGFWFLGRENERGAVQLDIENFAKLSEAMRWAWKNQASSIFEFHCGIKLELCQIDRVIDVYYDRKMPRLVGVRKMHNEGLIRYQGKWKKRKRVLTDLGKALAEEIIAAG